MAKRYLRSDSSEAEAHFYTEGIPIVGECNMITSLFRLVGYYLDYCAGIAPKNITEYNPDTDIFFKYENAGITELKRVMTEHGTKISRKYFRNISRKWFPSSVVLSYDTDKIVLELLSYINSRPTLREAYTQYLVGKNTDWHFAMPIQFDFLRTRRERRVVKGSQEAGRIIRDLPSIEA